MKLLLRQMCVILENAIAAACLTAMFLSHVALANGHVTETVYSTDAFIRVLIAGIGGVLAILGVVLAFKNAMVLSDVSLSRSSAQFKKISQGVVIALLGVVVLVAGLYLLPDKTSVTDISGKQIIRDGGRTQAAH
jgi:hypothetical protein